MLVKVEQIVLALQGNELKIGDLAEQLKESISRNQIK